MGRVRGKRKRAPEIIGPTPEQAARREYELTDVVDKQADGRSIAIGKANTLVREIARLLNKGVISHAEYKALKHYQHHAEMVDRSLVRDSMANALCSIRGTSGGDGPGVAMLNASRVTADCERAAGSLVDILRAVVVNDYTLSQWAMERGGAIEDCTIRKGQRVCRLKPRQKALAIAKLEIQMVAKRVEAELSA